MFGKFVKEKRLEKNLTLREFCRQLGEDASNWSKIEREKLAPPRDEAKLENIAGVLGIEKGSDEWNQLVDMANVDSGKIPDYIMSDEEVLKSMPLFFRTIGNVRPTPEELIELIENLKKAK